MENEILQRSMLEQCRPPRCDSRVLAAIEALHDQEYASVQALGKALLNDDQERPDGWFVLGLAALLKKEPENVNRYFERAILYRYACPEWFYQLGLWFERQNLKKEAAIWHLRALELQKSNAAAQEGFYRANATYYDGAIVGIVPPLLFLVEALLIPYVESGLSANPESRYPALLLLLVGSVLWYRLSVTWFLRGLHPKVRTALQNAPLPGPLRRAYYIIRRACNSFLGSERVILPITFAGTGILFAIVFGCVYSSVAVISRERGRLEITKVINQDKIPIFEGALHFDGTVQCAYVSEDTGMRTGNTIEVLVNREGLTDRTMSQCPFVTPLNKARRAIIPNLPLALLGWVLLLPNILRRRMIRLGGDVFGQAHIPI